MKLLQKDYFEWKKETWPLEYYQIGFFGLSGKLDNLDYENTIQPMCKQFLYSAQDLLRRKSKYLSVRENRHIGLIASETKACIEGIDLGGHVFAPINFAENSLGQILAYFEDEPNPGRRFRTLQKLPKHFDGLARLLEAGVTSGKTYSVEAIARLESQYKSLGVSDFLRHFRNLNETSDRAEKLIRENVMPRLRKLREFLFTKYRGQLRDEASVVTGLSGGQKFYGACLEYHTTIHDITPEEVRQNF